MQCQPPQTGRQTRLYVRPIHLHTARPARTGSTCSRPRSSKRSFHGWPWEVRRQDGSVRITNQPGPPTTTTTTNTNTKGEEAGGSVGGADGEGPAAVEHVVLGALGRRNEGYLDPWMLLQALKRCGQTRPRSISPCCLLEAACARTRTRFEPNQTNTMENSKAQSLGVEYLKARATGLQLSGRQVLSVDIAEADGVGPGGRRRRLAVGALVNAAGTCVHACHYVVDGMTDSLNRIPMHPTPTHAHKAPSPPPFWSPPPPPPPPASSPSPSAPASA